MTPYLEPDPELRHRTLPAGEARVAVLTRTYPTTVEDLWDACTNPERLARWYVPVSGDFRVGGTIAQAMMGSGEIVVCEAPSYLKVSLAGGVDEIEVRLALHLRGTLPADYDTLTFHQNPVMRPVIERGSAAMAALLEAAS